MATKQPTEPSDAGRDEKIHKLAVQLNLSPSTELVEMAKAAWINAMGQWRQKRGPKPDLAKCITSAAETIRRSAAAAPQPAVSESAPADPAGVKGA